MGKGLHKLGLFAFRHPAWVVFVWVVIIAVLGLLAAQNFKPTSSSISIPGTEAQQALDRMKELFPKAGAGSGRIVFAAPEGKTIADYTDEIRSSSEAFGKIEGVTGVVDPTQNTAAVSQDKTIAYTQLQLSEGTGNVSEAAIDEVRAVVEKTRIDGLQVEMGGDIINRNPSEFLGPAEIGGLVLALLVLAVTLGTLVGAGMPIVTALVAVIVSMTGLFALSQVITISSTTPVLAVMLGLAVGIDYSLFIINRYRTYVLEGFRYEEAAARAIGTAGNAVVFAAATVVIALAALTVVQIPFMTTMGLSAAAAIAVAATVAITLVPALLRFGRSLVFPRGVRRAIAAAQKRGARENHHAKRTTIWYKWGTVITERPVIVLLTGVVVLGVLALPARDLRLGLPTDEHAALASTERKAYDLLAKGFGPGFNGPLLVVAENIPAVTEADYQALHAQALEEFDKKAREATMQQQVLFEERLTAAQTPEQYAALQQEIVAAQAQAEQQRAAGLVEVENTARQYSQYAQLKKIADKIAVFDGVKTATPALVTEDTKNGLIQVIPETGPSDQATVDLITALRDPADKEQATGNPNVTLLVTGSTALQLDVNAKLAAALPLYLSVVIGLSFIILVVAFRSILVPLKATLGFLLSVAVMFGALVAVFQWGWFGVTDAPGPIISFLPIIAIGVLFGLAMDYEFFLVSSMHEAYRETNDAKRAVRRGFAHASKVVVAAGFIMVAIFAGFIGNHDATIQTIGFGLAVGILIDAFVVRLTLVPAAMTLLGNAAWWLPKWLDRVLPHVSIEGEDEQVKKVRKRSRS